MMPLRWSWSSSSGARMNCCLQLCAFTTMTEHCKECSCLTIWPSSPPLAKSNATCSGPPIGQTWLHLPKFVIRWKWCDEALYAGQPWREGSFFCHGLQHTICYRPELWTYTFILLSFIPVQNANKPKFLTRPHQSLPAPTHTGEIQ